MDLVKSAKALLPSQLRHVLSRAIWPYRHGRRFFTPYTVTKDMEGETFQFFVGDRTGRDWYDRPCINNPVWREMRFVRDQMIVPGDVIFEAGGHHGCSVILLSRWVGDDGKVVTFEPLGNNFEILERNVRLNQLTNVVAKREALGATAGTIFFDEVLSGIGTTGIPVPVARLDDYASLNPSFLKLDVEGFEVDVLRGATAILATRPKVEIEVHTDLLPLYGASVNDIFRLMDVEGYDVWVQWRDDQMPVRYDRCTPITTRVHLFFLPRRT